MFCIPNLHRTCVGHVNLKNYLHFNVIYHVVIYYLLHHFFVAFLALRNITVVIYHWNIISQALYYNVTVKINILLLAQHCIRLSCVARISCDLWLLMTYLDFCNVLETDVLLESREVTEISDCLVLTSAGLKSCLYCWTISGHVSVFLCLPKWLHIY